MSVYKFSASGGLTTGRTMYTSMLAGNETFSPSSFDLISTTTLSSSQSSVSFNVSSLAAGYKHLQIRATAMIAGSSNDNIDLTFNGDTGNNYSYHALYGTGGLLRSEASAPRVNLAAVLPVAPAGVYPGQFTASIIDILDPFITSKNTTVRTSTGRPQSDSMYVGLHSGAWLNLAAVTSITLTGRSNSIVSGSRFSLYGIKG